MLRSALVAATLLCSSALAQNVTQDCTPCGGAPKYAGTYVLATGQLIPPGNSPSASPSEAVIYNNTCETGLFSATLNGTTLVDDGRVPSSSSPSPAIGVLNNYRVNKFEIQYCTKDLTGVFSVRVRFWQSLLMDSFSCTTLGGAGTATADFTLTNIPGAATTGTLACYTLTVDLTGFEFCMKGDADGAFNADAFGNGFGYGLTMSGQTGTTTSTSGGFAIAGQSVTCGFGEGTYYNSPGSLNGTGLDNDLRFYRDGQGGQSSGCLSFTGLGTGAAGVYMKILADINDCTSCAGNPDDDGDGTLNCLDGCPSDATKTAPGQCGCGVPDTDSDGDGTADCNDGCPFDPAKSAPGQCGCGVPDIDTDGDGTADCIDGCPNDPNKIAPNLCGCGVPDIDSDSDGAADCVDGCPFDPNKFAPGVCGCGTPDTDTDGDGTPDCNDLCPNDPAKTTPGLCGCGLPDIDSDGDGALDCVDGCPFDPLKETPGVCGCGVVDFDSDGDGIDDCADNCPNISNPGQEDCNANGIGDVCDLASNFSLDTNGDNIPDDCQAGSGTPYCFGDGTGLTCPCGNSGAAGEGCKNSTGNGSLFYNLGGASVGANDTQMYSVRMPLNKFGLVFMGTQNFGGTTFGDGLRCVKGFTHRFGVHSTGSTGSYSLIGPAALAPNLIVPGVTWYFQSWYRDTTFGTCTSSFNLTNALQIDFLP